MIYLMLVRLETVYDDPSQGQHKAEEVSKVDMTQIVPKPKPEVQQ
jgi:hypothetical protein